MQNASRVGREWSQAEDIELRDLVAKNLSPQRIGVKLRRSQSAIRRRCAVLNVKLRSKRDIQRATQISAEHRVFM
jgi:hypothetical protein